MALLQNSRYCSAVVKTLPAKPETSSIPGSERSPEMGSGNPLQYFCLENSMDRRALQATIHEVAKSWTLLSMHACHVKYLRGRINTKRGPL